MSVSVLLTAGARPNFMKIAPVLRGLLDGREPCSAGWLHTGQHFDENMSDVFVRELGLPEPLACLDVGGLEPAVQLGEIVVPFARWLAANRPRLVAVPGDVTSTVACALTANKLGIATAHIEAGLRSFDRTMPEEINRLVTDHVSELLLVSEPSGRANLAREGITGDRVVEVGNVMIDSLVTVLKRLGITRRQPRGRRRLVLVTLHRPKNVDDRLRLNRLADFLISLGTDAEVVFPVHPRTRRRLRDYNIEQTLSRRIRLLDPLGYLDFTRLLVESHLLVTDSGGLQEESAYLGVPCLTLRESTERPITLAAGTNLLEPSRNGDLLKAARELMAGDYPQIGENEVLKAALWDGRAGERIAGALTKYVRTTT